MAIDGQKSPSLSQEGQTMPSKTGTALMIVPIYPTPTSFVGCKLQLRCRQQSPQKLVPDLKDLSRRAPLTSMRLQVELNNPSQDAKGKKHRGGKALARWHTRQGKIPALARATAPFFYTRT